MSKLENYKIKKCVGATELTMLYLAQHKYLGSDLIIEASAYGHDKDLEQRLKYLAQLLGKLNHNKILPIVDAFEDKEKLYLIFSWQEQMNDLSSILKSEKKLSLDRSLKLTLDICDILGYLQNQKIVHQNLQPSNILITENSLFLGGFILANSLEKPFQGTICKLDEARYASPEWVLKKPLCFEQDIWGLGVCMYQMLSGKLPFEGDADKSTGQYIIEGKFEPLKELVPDIPDSINDLIIRLFSLKKEERPAIDEIKEIVAGELYKKPIANAFVAMPFHPQLIRK